MNRQVYLDYAATAPMLDVVKQAMFETIELQLGNASSLHSRGRVANEIVTNARAEIARLIGAMPEEIIFTSGGTESNNTVTEIYRGKTVAVSAIEHPSMLESTRVRAGKVFEIPVDRWGFIKMEAVKQAASSGADLVSIMLASNELGSIEPIKDVVKCCKNYNTSVHTDATQAFGKIHLDVKELGVDYMTISAHKIGGPVGVGALYVRKGAKFSPLMIGGHQEARHRAGTTNTVAIAGFGAAAKWCYDNWSCKKYEQIAKLRDRLVKKIKQTIPYSSQNSPYSNCLPNILNMSFQAAEGESIQLYLDAAGVSVSTGSACASGDIRPSHVLMATRNDAEVAHSSIRFSLGLDTTEEDVDFLVQALKPIIERLQGISTIKLKEEYE